VIAGYCVDLVICCLLKRPEVVTATVAISQRSLLQFSGGLQELALLENRGILRGLDTMTDNSAEGLVEPEEIRVEEAEDDVK
jgi:hypothetical protein